jgi:DNA invertase Pin-like site-specific DNA recombinase
LLDRPGLTKLLEELRRGDVVLVAKRDRLGREVLFVQLLQADIERRGAWVESAAGEGNGDQPADKLMRNLIDSFSEYERDQIRARTKAALAVKASRSERVGAIPYGFRLLPDGVHIEPHPTETKIKQLAKAIRASGRSFAKVGAELAELGYFSRNGKPFEASQIKRMVER